MEMISAAEKFLAEFFQARTATLRTIVEMRKPYRQKYYDEKCLLDSRRGVVERSASEKIVDGSRSEAGFAIVTDGGGILSHRRYTLRQTGESWLIASVELECISCRMSGTRGDCVCKGEGWFVVGDDCSLPERGLTAQRAIRTPECHATGAYTSVSAFMRELFEARTSITRKEIATYQEFAIKYFAPTFDWTRSVVSVAWSEAEHVMQVAEVASGFEVITEGAFLPQKYELTRRGESLLVRDVQIGCVSCIRRARNPDCVLCDGTMWMKKLGRRG